MGYNPIQDWVAGRDDEPGPEEQLLLSPWERSADPKGDGRKIGGPPSRDADARHGRGYITNKDDDKRNSDDGLVEAAMAAALGAWFVLPAIRLVRRGIFYVILVCLVLWLLR